MRSIRRCVLAMLSLAFTFGCATGRVTYEKSGGTEADRKRDASECVQASIGHEPGRHLLTPVVVDREAYAKCLESRGYSRVP